jgi:predicted phosphoribosyltransferase
MQVFRDRRHAGQLLAQRFDRYIADPAAIVLALPRGGVPVAYEIATRLGAPLDVLVVRKLGVPGYAELAMGAIASDGIWIVDRRVIDMLGVSREAFEAVVARERTELDRRERAFRAGRRRLDLAGRSVILVDDGLATGASMAAAIDAVRTRKPARIIGAAPVAPPEVHDALGDRADEMICLVTPARLHAVGAWYVDFTQTGDSEVRALLDAAARERAAHGAQPRAEPASSAHRASLRRRRQRLALLDDVRRDHHGLALAGVLAGVHRARRDEEPLAGLHGLGRLAVDLDGQLAREDEADLLARMAVPGDRGAGLELAARLHGLVVGRGDVVALQLDALEPRGHRRRRLGGLRAGLGTPRPGEAGEAGDQGDRDDQMRGESTIGHLCVAPS